MHCRTMKLIAAIPIVLGVFLAGTGNAGEILGVKPSHVTGVSNSVPNGQAISRMIWAPGIDDGYVPQGVAWADGALYVSGYRSSEPAIGRGPCRVFKVDPASGNTLGQLDLPADCGHAGGLAYAGNGLLIASDTRRLYRIDLAAAFPAANTSNAVTGTVPLGGEMKGSFAGFDGRAVLAGSYERDPTKAKGHFLPLSVFDASNGTTVDETMAARSIPLPRKAQGAAFDKGGNLWITASSSQFGLLYKLDAKTGQIASSYEMVIGIEDIAFDGEGNLWAVSEAGSLRWRYWGVTFPVLFRLDLSSLKETR